VDDVSRARDLWHFLRLSAFGATATLPLLGALSADRRLPARRAAGLLGVAACFHAFAYVHNDLCDLPLDRGQPLRAAYPLVRGAISPRAALAFALACVPAAFALDEGVVQAARRRGDAAGVGGGRPAAALAAAFALLAAYNRWGKRCPFPPLTDAVQGLGWAALLWYGAAAAGRPAQLTAALARYELLLIMLVNGVHGALRDLANDAAGGARTTALMLGATAGEGGAIRATPALAAYALGLQAAMLGVVGHALGANLAGHTARQRAGAVLGSGLLAAGLPGLLLAAARGRVGAREVGMLHLVLVLSAPLALVAPGAAPAPLAALLAAHLAPLLANGMTYDSLRALLGGRGAP